MSILIKLRENLTEYKLYFINIQSDFKNVYNMRYRNIKKIISSIIGLDSSSILIGVSGLSNNNSKEKSSFKFFIFFKPVLYFFK